MSCKKKSENIWCIFHIHEAIPLVSILVDHLTKKCAKIAFAKKQEFIEIIFFVMEIVKSPENYKIKIYCQEKECTLNLVHFLRCFLVFFTFTCSLG